MKIEVELDAKPKIFRHASELVRLEIGVFFKVDWGF